MVNRQTSVITGALSHQLHSALSLKDPSCAQRSPCSTIGHGDSGHGCSPTPGRGPDGETIINPASEMVRQSPLTLAKLRFPENDPRWRIPGYNRKKEPRL
jgi:hypothetical protein